MGPGETAARTLLTERYANKGKTGLGIVYILDRMTTEFPQESAQIKALADAEYSVQRAASAAKGGTVFSIKQGHLPYKVAQHYGGTLAELSAVNPGKTFQKSWNSATPWLLPLDWNAERKQLAPTYQL